MTELSPSAKIILAASAKANCLQEWDHVNDPPCHPGDSDWNGCYACVHRAGIAAALRAAVDQSHPKAHIEDIDYVHQSYVDGWKDALDVILAVADELEAQ